MDFYIDIAVAFFLRLLKDRRAWPRYADAMAKVYVNLRRAVEIDVTLQKAVERQEAKL